MDCIEKLSIGKLIQKNSNNIEMLEKDPIQNLQYDSQIRPPSQPQRSAPDPPSMSHLDL